MKLRNKLKAIYRYVNKLFQNRIFRFIIQGIILVVCIFYLVSNFQNSKDLLANVNINYPALILSFLVTALSVYLGALGWGLTLKSVGEAIPRRESTQIHLASNLAKYIPGYAWQLAGKAYLTNQAGGSSYGIGFAMILELAQLFLFGFGLILVFLPRELVLDLNQLKFLVDQINIVHAIGFLFLFIIPVIIFLIVRTIGKIRQKKINLNPLSLIYASSAILAGWLVLGISFWLLGVVFLPIENSNFPQFVFTLAASFLIGFIIIIIPNSIGVRESIMVYLLTLFNISSPIAVLIAAFSRFILTLSELSLYLINKLTIRRRKIS